ncbi:MAG: hypothetical protein AAB908_02430 [Patescibacteria group bacterium]
MSSIDSIHEGDFIGVVESAHEENVVKNPFNYIGITPEMESSLVIAPKVLVSARFLYFPARSGVLREFNLQHDDVLPDLPWLFDFISFWKREIDGKLRRVEWMCGRLDHTVRHPGFHCEI